ncbi:hypothetical protein D3C80_1098650 [compost metagenome]
MLTEESATFMPNSLEFLESKNNCRAVFSPSALLAETTFLSAVIIDSVIGLENLATKNTF